jgi:hypothetical protein
VTTAAENSDVSPMSCLALAVVNAPAATGGKPPANAASGVAPGQRCAAAIAPLGTVLPSSRCARTRPTVHRKQRADGKRRDGVHRLPSTPSVPLAIHNAHPERQQSCLPR